METRVVPATLEYLPEIMDFIETFLDNPDCKMMDVRYVGVSVEEIFTNIASYAYEEEGGRVEISCGFAGESEEKRIWICFRDWGRPYNPLKQPEPDFNIPFEERSIGGLGVYMVRKFMDHIEYCYEDGCNILKIEKSL